MELNVTTTIPDDVIARQLDEKLKKVKLVDPFPSVMNKSIASKFLNCSRSTLDKWINSKGLPVHKINGNYLFLKSELLNWVAKQP